MFVRGRIPLKVKPGAKKGGAEMSAASFEKSRLELVGTLQGHSRAVSSVSFSPDGTKFASGSWDKTVKL